MSKQHLELRGGVYYYRRRVPGYAAATMGTNLIKKSLGTSDLKAAIKKRMADASHRQPTSRLSSFPDVRLVDG